jgi:integrase
MNSVEPIRDPELALSLVNALWSAHPKYAVMYLVGVDTGLRISDILNLRVRDIKRTATKGFIVTEIKTKKCRHVSLSKETYKRIRDFIAVMRLLPHHFLVYSREDRKDKPLSRIQAYRVISSKSRLFFDFPHGTHSMRKTYALNQYRAHGSINALKNDFQHRDISTTISYLVSREKLEELIGK